MNDQETKKPFERPACPDSAAQNENSTQCAENIDVRVHSDRDILNFLRKSRLLTIDFDDDLRDRSTGRVADFDE